MDVSSFIGGLPLLGRILRLPDMCSLETTLLRC